MDKGGGLTLDTAKLVVRDNGQKVHVFPSMLAALGYQPPQDKTRLQVSDLLPQIVVGHRQWRDAEDQDERFVHAEPEFRYDEKKRTVWVCISVRLDDLSRYDFTPATILDDGKLGAAFRQARSLDAEAHCFELRETAKYKNDPVEVIQKLAGLVRPYLWEIVSAIPGSAYRRYYIYLGAQAIPRERVHSGAGYVLISPPTATSRLYRITELLLMA